MKQEKKLQILTAIRDGKKFSRNNKDMATLRANGYINAVGVVNCSYVKAEITLTEWGEAWLREEERGI